MIRDHTEANQELAQLAARKDVRLPRRPNVYQRRIIRRLARLSGKHFDCAYMPSRCAPSRRLPSSGGRCATAATQT